MQLVRVIVRESVRVTRKRVRLWSSGVESRLVRKIVRVRIIASRNRRYALGKGIKDKMLNCTNPAVILQDDRGDSILP